MLSKLVADSERTICNSAELIDRLLKDIVVEQAATYVSALVPEPPEPGVPTLRPGDEHPTTKLPDVPGDTYGMADRAFSLERFIPLLTERVHVLNPYTRTFLVNWLATLDSVPELELVSYLPLFLDGLLKYISDVSQEIRNLTMSVLADFLDSIRTAAEVARAREEAAANRRANEAERARKASSRPPVDALPEVGLRRGADGAPAVLHPDEAAAPDPDQSAIYTGEGGSTEPDELEPEADDEGVGLGTWEPGQGVVVDHAAIVEILLEHLRPGYGTRSLGLAALTDRRGSGCPANLPRLDQRVPPVRRASHAACHASPHLSHPADARASCPSALRGGPQHQRDAKRGHLQSARVERGVA